ncbi:hypothetical protein RN001_000844 [Aquatica leii]|uniref:Anoctamin n=1 Tax=Aquatica leii TaxID=1421715 RepID=A0AAN7PFT3_9COLE|nr:hypothetical protein RN001_000844 [Aquatica leii]
MATEDNDFVETESENNEGSNLRHRKFVERAQETFEQASELLTRKIPCAGYFLSPKRLWLKRVATPNCDVVVVFPPGTDDSILLWLLSRLRQSSGLNVHVRHHATTQSSAFYLTASFSLLLKAAEDFHLPKQVQLVRGGGLKEFTVRDLHCFENADNEQQFFTSQERQWLVLRLLESIRAKTSDLDKVTGVTLLEGQLIIPKCLLAGVISQVFPLHDPPTLERLQKIWVRDIHSEQPIDEICDYFGVKIGMYFAWLGHYTMVLSIPAIVGFLFWLCCNGKNQHLEDVGFVLFSLFNVVWTTVYLQAWKRYSAELAFRWGTLDERKDLLADPRPLFRGPLQPSPVTGRLEPWQPAWRRHFYRYFVSVPLIAVCLAAVFIVMIVSLQIQDWWDRQLYARGLPSWLGYVPKVMLAIVISLMDEAYLKIAVWLNDKENYRLETKYENHLIGKVALFQFVNSFLSLFYIAFYLQDQARLKEQLAALLISRQVIGNLKESAWPYMLEHMRLAKMSFDLWGVLTPTGTRSPPGVKESENPEETNETTATQNSANFKRSISQAELESSLFKYDGTFADHLEMMIQLGYVILFSSAFPPAAICALLNNFIEIRSDAFKLGYICQRPFGQRVPNIGTWQNCMEYMGIMAVLVNCALIGLSGQVHRMFPDMTATQTILLIVALEHIMLCIRFLITCAIPDLPSWLATEMAKIEWARREASRVSLTATPSPEDAMTKLIGRFSVSPSHGQGKDENSEKLKESEMLKEVIEARQIATPIHATPTPTPTSTNKHNIHHHPLSITPDSIQPIPPFKPRKSKEWVPAEGEPSHHLTIGPSGGVEWTRKLKEEQDIHRSTDCITSKDASSSDSDLLRGSPIWPPRPRSPSGSNSNNNVPLRTRTPVQPADANLSDSTRSISSQEAEDQVKTSAEELAAKKTRVKQSLMKRARSVAIFSLKLKERRAREAQEKANKPPVTPTNTLPPPSVGGELSCIPIEKLIQVEDLRRNQPRPNQSGTL